jgi:hypothetical protein
MVTNVQDDAGFIPYIIVVRFDKDENLKDRLRDSLARLQESLRAMGDLLPLLSSYEGSLVAYLLAAHQDYQPDRVLSQLASPKSGRPSGLIVSDRVFIAAIEVGTASKLEHATKWLREYGALADQ